MKQSLILCLIVLVLCAFNSFGQSSNFIVGMYSNADSTRNDLIQSIANLNMNTLIHQIRNGTTVLPTSPAFQNTIPALAQYNHDYINYYTNGGYFKWKAYYNTPSLYVGIKHKFGKDTVLANNDSCWQSGRAPSITNSDSLICGPNYFQYGSNSDGRITYTVKIRIKRKDLKLPAINNDNNEVGTFYVCFNGNLVTGATQTILANEINTTNMDWSSISLVYQYPTSYPYHSSSNNHPAAYRSITSTLSSPYRGTEFVFKWNGNYEVFIKDIEISDSRGVDIKTNININSIITNYANSNTCTNLKYFYSFDEPASHDRFTPYKDIDNMLPTGKKLITAYVPYSNQDGVYLGWKTFPYWLNNASPQTLMFDFYPINSHLSTLDDMVNMEHQFYFLKEMCRAADSLKKNNYYYIAQGHGYYDKNGNFDLHQPNANQVSAMTMLALAHGAKGIFYYAYKSSGQNNIDQVYGVDNNSLGAGSKITNIGSRLNGSLGNTLNKLSYSRNTLTLIKNVNNDAEPNRYSDSYDFLSVSLPTVSESYACFVCSVFNETIPTDASTKYFFILNSLTSTNTCTKKINITLTKPNDFVNYRLVNIEKGVSQVQDNVDISSSSNITLPNSSYPNYEIPHGEGYLYKYGPVVKVGGTIVSNETISSATTLTAPLTIGSGSTLTINSPYTANNQLISIAVVSNGSTDIWGNLVLGSQGSITNSNIETALIASRENNHPKLVWGVPNPSSIGSYKIYRKKETADFVEIATVSGVNSYVDNNVNIAYLPEANETAAQYKIKLASNTTYSNTVTYSRVQGSGESKIVSEKKKEENKIFSCSNYPNPFNPTTTISYQIPSAEKVTLKIFDVLGKEIITLVDSYKEAGEYKATFDAAKLPSGVYIYRLEAGKFVESKKMILTK